MIDLKLIDNPTEGVERVDQKLQIHHWGGGSGTISSRASGRFGTNSGIISSGSSGRFNTYLILPSFFRISCTISPGGRRWVMVLC